MLTPIGRIRSPYPEKFGVPRQPGLAPSVASVVVLDADRVPVEALRGLGEVSHIWVIFLFHLARATNAATVRPPRLGGNERLGVLATRSPFRQNPIGLSAVRLVGVDGHELTVAGGDFVDQTPVLDVKPYLPYADSIADAECAWAKAPPVPVEVHLTEPAAAQLARQPQSDELLTIIEQSLRWDPRPAYRAQRDDERCYGTHIRDVNVRWKVEANAIMVTAIEGD